MRHILPVVLFVCLSSLICGSVNFAVSIRWFAIAEMLRSLAADIMLLAPVLLLPARFGVLLMRLLFLPLMGATLGSVLHLLVYRAQLAPYAIQSAFETSPSESREFFSEFLTLPNVVVFTAVIVLFFLTLRKATRSLPKVPRSKALLAVCLIAFVAVVGVSVKKGKRFLHSNIIFMGVHTLANYTNDLRLVKDLHSRRENQHFPGIELLDGDADEERLYVFIIGESGNRHHQSLYGYHRETNPELEALGPDLLVFRDVVSADTHTIPALRKTLLFHDLDADTNILARRSLIALLRNAGFETFWLSNQTPNADGLTGTAVLAGDASNTRFFNRAKNEGSGVSYDGVLVDALEDVLLDPSPKKAVFLHLLGSHLSYALRYPSDFKKFTETGDIPDAPWRSESNKEYVNTYDNSILYTNHIIRSVIDRVAQENKRSMVIYFSDHGQEVYDSLPIRGQATRTPTRYMVDVPFLCWFSEQYRQANEEFVRGIAGKLDAPYTLEMFAHTGADAARIRFEGLDRKRSLFAPEFTPIVRRLPDGKKYDDLPPVGN